MNLQIRFLMWIVFFLIGSTASAQERPGLFHVGAAKRVVTPNPLAPLSSGGIGRQIPSSSKLGELYVRAMVVEKSGERIAIVSIDNLGWPAALGERSRALIQGIPPENVVIGATHSHSAQGGMVTADDRGPDWKSLGTWEEAVRIGTLLADEALRVLREEKAQESPARYCTSRRISFPISSPMIQFILEHSPLPYAVVDGSRIQGRINLINLGSAQILTIPGEALPNIGYYLKRNMRTSHPFLFGLTNDAFGYIVTKVDFNGFDRYRYISEKNLGDEAGEIFIEEALRLIKDSPVAGPIP